MPLRRLHAYRREEENRLIIHSVNLETVCGYTSRLPEHQVPEFAFAGRSNVGKSTLINALMNRKSYARVSGKPGKTQTINYYNINNGFYLVDLPGYGFAKVDKKEKERWGTMMQEYFTTAEELKHVLCLVDIRHDPTQDDCVMNRFLREMSIPFTVVATKADKISRGARGKYLAPICRALSVQPWEVICFSGEDGTGRDDLIRRIDEVLAE